MWSSSSESRQGGFSLVEMLVSLLMVAILLVAAAQLVFATRRATLRQTMQVEARQMARGAADYLALMVRGATDLNPLGRNSDAIVTWLAPVSAFPLAACPGTGCIQASWDNVGTRSGDPSNLADRGTDILVIAHANSGMAIPLNEWPSFPTASNAYWTFADGCPSDGANMAQFQQVTGYDAGTGMSPPLIGVDASNNPYWYQITGYQTSDCSGKNPCNGSPCVHVVANPGKSGDLNLPGGQRTGAPEKLLAGVQFASFRVCQGWLEQKIGIFNPAVDNNCGQPGWNQDPWTPLLPNVEDLQVVWIYDSGSIYDNSPTSELPSQGAVPPQGTPGSALDVTHVLALRVTVTAHSSAPVEIANIGRFFRPAAENRAAATTADALYHFQASANAVLRNRVPGL